MTCNNRVRTEGADIVYDYEGQGPLLLLIAGGNGNGTRFARLAGHLASNYTVVSYDRRAECRSTGDTTVDLDMAQQARDATAVLRAMGAEDAYVFGNSAGANIGIKLAEDHPKVIKALIAHEPPVMSILPDAEKELRFVDDVYATFQAQGAPAAMKKFAQSLVGFDAPIEAPGDQNRDSFDHFMAHSYLNISRYKPDLDTIRRNRVRVVTAAGRRSADAYYARTARVMAERLGCRYVDMSGNHLAFVIEPAVFAAELRDVLRGISMPTTSAPTIARASDGPVNRLVQEKR
jgi:pimeloyl-ACP methyl ester carboxylesterase